LHENWKDVKYKEYVSKHLEKGMYLLFILIMTLKGEKKMDLEEFLENHDYKKKKKITKLIHIVLLLNILNNYFSLNKK